MTTNFSNSFSGVPKEPILGVYGRPGGERHFVPLPVVHDKNASCRTITSAVFTSFRLDLTSSPLDDGHSCRHQSCRARVELTLCRGKTTYVYAFCVLEGNEMVAVMTGKESCWTQPVQGKCIAAVAIVRTDDEEEEIMRRRQEEGYARADWECDEQNRREDAEFEAMAERDRARRQQQQQQQQQAEQAQIQQAQMQQAQSHQDGQQKN